VGLEQAFDKETLNPSPLFFLETHLTVQIAAEISGYNAQYLRRPLRTGTLNGDKIDQIWLIRKTSLEKYLKKTQRDNDQIFGPKQGEIGASGAILLFSKWAREDPVEKKQKEDSKPRNCS
jgi:hypothetical protein